MDSEWLYRERDAEVYDLEHAGMTDAGYWRQIADLYGGQGPVLEIGCGTMRVGLPIARSGKRYHGIDNSPYMLEAAKGKLKDEQPEVQERIQLHQGDMAGFDLDTRFTLILMPLNVLAFALDTDTQLRVLENVKRHLFDDGVLALDVFMPAVRNLGSMGEQWWPEPDLEIADRHIQTDVRFSIDSPAQRIEMIRRHKSYSSSSLVSEWLSGHRFTFMFPRELRLLINHAGFRIIKEYGNYQLDPVSDPASQNQQLIVACKRPA